MLLWAAGRPDLALEQLQKAREMDPNFPHVHWQLGLVRLWKGELAEAAAEFQTARTLSPSVTMYTGGLGHVYAREGSTAEARRLLQGLKELSKRRYVSGLDLASVYIGLGEKDNAFASLEKAYKQRDPRLIIWLNRHPEFATLRSDPRVQNLLHQIGLPEAVK